MYIELVLNGFNLSFVQKSPADLSDQDAHNHTELVQGAEGSSEGSGWHLAHIHRSQAGKETAEQADDQTTGDHHLIGGAHGGEAHEEAADHRQRVHQEHGATPEEEEEEEEEEGQEEKQITWLLNWNPKANSTWEGWCGGNNLYNITNIVKPTYFRKCFWTILDVCLQE